MTELISLLRMYQSVLALLAVVLGGGSFLFCVVFYDQPLEYLQEHTIFAGKHTWLPFVLGSFLIVNVGFTLMYSFMYLLDFIKNVSSGK
jgi:hypothetical protein